MNFDPTGWEQDPNGDYGYGDVPHKTYMNIPHGPSAIEESLSPVQVKITSPSQVCFYGQKCKYVGCNRVHLDDAHTPCLYGPGCKKAGCLKTHPTRFDQECYYDEECKLSWCRYIHTKDKCKYGSECSVAGCKYVHPKS